MKTFLRFLFALAIATAVSAAPTTPINNPSLTGIVTMPNGSAANPSWGFSSSQTTGLYWGNPGIGFSVGGTSVGTMTSTGLNGMAIGATTAAAGSFTTLAASGTLSVTGASTLTGNVTAKGTVNIFNGLGGTAGTPNGGVGQFVAASTHGISAGFSDNVSDSLYISHPAGGAMIGTDAGGGLQFATNGTTLALTLDASQNATFAKKIISYNGVTTAGNGAAVVVSAPRTAANTNALWAPASYTTPAVDTSYEVSANINVTATTAAAMTCTCVYTDETNTSRTLTLGFTQLSGATILTSITNVTGTGPYESLTYHIRCKASTTITFATAGTVTGITYNAEATALQIL